MRKLFALLLALWAGPALAQSNPGWVFGFVPTPAQWNAEWSTKLDYNPSGLPVTAGGTGVLTFTANAPLIGAGTSAIAQGTRSGNTTVFGTTSGTLTSGHCVQFDSSGNLVDAGGVCTTGGGGGTVTSGTANSLAYYATTGTAVTGLTSCNSGIIVTSSGGVPSCSTTLPAINIAAGTALPLTGLANIGANTEVANWTNSSGAPVAHTMPVCTTAQVLVYTAGTGFACGAATPLTVTGTGFSTASSLALRNAVTANVQLDFGAACDGSTDDTSAFTAAFATAQTVVVPSAACVSNSGFTVPTGKTLQGTSFSAGYPITSGTSIIECPASVSHCVTLGNGSTNDTTVVRNISILGTGGTPTGTSNGLYVNGGYNVVLDTVNVRNFQYLYHFQGQPSTGSGISAHAQLLFGAQAGLAYVWQDGWPELYINNARLGSNGSADYNTVQAFFQISGPASTAPNTLVLTDIQANQGTGTGVLYGLSWVNCTAGPPCVPTIDGTTWKVADSHFEGLTSGFLHSDSTWNVIQRLDVTDVVVNNPSAPCTLLNTATSLSQSSFKGNKFFCNAFTVSPSSESIDFTNFYSNFFQGTVAFTPGSGTSTIGFSDNNFNGAATFTGNMSLALHGNTYASTLTLTPTGDVAMSEPGLIYNFASLPTCSSGERLSSLTVINGSTTYNVGQAIAGGGSTQLRASCANGTWVAG